MGKEWNSFSRGDGKEGLRRRKVGKKNNGKSIREGPSLGGGGKVYSCRQRSLRKAVPEIRVLWTRGGRLQNQGEEKKKENQPSGKNSEEGKEDQTLSMPIMG